MGDGLVEPFLEDALRHFLRFLVLLHLRGPGLRSARDRERLGILPHVVDVTCVKLLRSCYMGSGDTTPLMMTGVTRHRSHPLYGVVSSESERGIVRQRSERRNTKGCPGLHLSSYTSMLGDI